MKRFGGYALLGALVLVACGGGSSSSSSTSSSSAPAQSSAAPKGPPAASLTLTGDAGVAGAVAGATVSCDNPGFDGNSITVGGTAAGSDPATGIAVTTFISQGKVLVRLSTGSGTTFTTREFTGSGLTGFDPATGTQIDSPLTETTAASSNKGTIGAITAMKGSVDCGNFNPGTATVKLTGTTPEGQVNGTLDPVLVTCSTQPQGAFVVVRGIVNVGSTKAMFFVTSQPTTALMVFETLQPSGQHTYLGPVNSGTPTATGVTIKSDAVQQGVDQSPILHIEGDAHCG